MKTQNTLENKARFFAQYWGQHVLYFSSGFLRKIDNLTLDSVENDDYLELKPLSNISNEDAIEIGKITGCWTAEEVVECGDEINYELIKYGKLFCDGVGKKWGLGMSCPFVGTLQDIIDAIDYLRLKSYALPYMDLSVEDLIDYGWVKLKGN